MARDRQAGWGLGVSLNAGAYTQRVRFERRASQADDGYGNVVGAWATLITVWAAFRPVFRPVFGREAIAAGRLESTRQGVLTIRRSLAAQAIRADDRVVFVSGEWSGETAQIRSIVPTMDRADIEMNLEIGVMT